MCAVLLALAPNPDLFILLFTFDIWLFGYHHVIATYTRLAMDTESIKEHWFLISVLPVLVIGGTILAVKLFGFWILATVYLYWQWFHYMRQSYGVGQAYQRKAGVKISKPFGLKTLIAWKTPWQEWAYWGVIYGIPLTGILYRSSQHPTMFLRAPIWVIPVDSAWVFGVGFLAALASALYCVEQRRQYLAHKAGEPSNFSWGKVSYMLSHWLIFVVGYIVIDRIDYGWLVVNIWHNSQYLLFVWLFHNQRFGNQFNPKHPVISFLAEKRHIWAYILICLSLTSVIYMGLNSLLNQVTFAGIALIVVMYQVLNFHHYIVDSVIWKIRKQST